MSSIRLLITSSLLCLAALVQAQEKSPVKFGKVSPEDFNIKQSYDSGASAVIIADIGNSSFEGNVKGWFSLVHKRSKRVKIIDRKGFEAANVEIYLYSNGTDVETLDDLKAYTYNLENGKVTAVKLESSAVFKDKLNKNIVIRKFTLPAVKEGSIIEYSYTIKSDFLFNLQPWSFQSDYPCLWSEYEVGIPEFFRYVTIAHGFLKPVVTRNDSRETFHVTFQGENFRSERVDLPGNINYTRWVLKNVPALKEENFTSSISNYNSKVEFQLASQQFEGQAYHDYMGNWALLAKALMDSENFGADLDKNNGWLDEGLTSITKGCKTQLEKAGKIFAFLRDNFECTDHSRRSLDVSLKEVFKKKSGNVAEINLLLVAMLRHEKIVSSPVILSTRSNGFTNEIYPLLERFNYVVAVATIDSTDYTLDASRPYNGFGRLPSYCYNGHARMVGKEGCEAVYYVTDSLKERKLTSVYISNQEKGNMVGSFKSQLGYYESAALREKLKGSSASYFKDFKPAMGFDVTVSEGAIDSLKMPDEDALVRWDFSFKPSADEGIIYVTPMFTEAYKTNPFKSADRQYPVEMPYVTDETYILNMEVPEGYIVDEIPKSVKVAYNEDEGFFEYILQKSGNLIQLRSRVKLNKANFLPEDYESLRDFFAFIVKKQNEQIVLKKKS